MPDAPDHSTPSRCAGHSALRVRVDAGVAVVTIDHPPLNLLDAVLMTELGQLATGLADDASVRVVVLDSADPEYFVAHGDMGFVADPASFARLSEVLGDRPGLNPMQTLHERWRDLPQVTIAKLAGTARGGGSELALALDMRFAARGRGALGQFEVLTGIVPGGGATVYLPQLAGRARALEVVLGAQLVDADLAERYGLVNRALPPEELDPFVDALARRVAALPPGVAAAAVRAVDAALPPRTRGLAEEDEALRQTFARPAATALTLAALEAGAQTRDGERDLERLLEGLLPGPSERR